LLPHPATKKKKQKTPKSDHKVQILKKKSKNQKFQLKSKNIHTLMKQIGKAHLLTKKKKIKNKTRLLFEKKK
jgi:hypothetical protein